MLAQATSCFKHCCFGVFTLICLWLVNTASLHAGDQQKMLQLLITSDLHGWLSTSLIFPYRKRSGLLHIAGAIQKERSKNPDAILIDCGDLLQGAPLVHYAHRFKNSPLKRDPFFRMVLALNYDAITVGNHDLAINPLFRNTYLPASNFKWLGANISWNGDLPIYPYLILHRNGLKIAIIGLVTPGVQMWLSSEQLEGIYINSAEDSLRKWLKYIRQKESPDLMIGVFHIGLNSFRDNVNSKLRRLPVANGAKAAIKAVDGLDIAVLGHDHTLSPRKSNDNITYLKKTLVLSGGYWGEALISLKLNLQKMGGVWRIAGVDKKVIPASQDVDIENTYRQMLSDEYINYLFAKLPYRFERTTQSKAEKCFDMINSLSSNLSSFDGTILPAIRVRNIDNYIGKEITRRDLFHWLPYDNGLVIVFMSRREIALIAKRYRLEGGDGGPRFRNVHLFMNDRIELSDFQGGWLIKDDFDRKFQIVVSDYHFHGGGGVLSQYFVHQRKAFRYLKDITRDRFFNYLTTYTGSLPKSCQFLRRMEKRAGHPP